MSNKDIESLFREYIVARDCDQVDVAFLLMCGDIEEYDILHYITQKTTFVLEYNISVKNGKIIKCEKLNETEF